VYFGSVLPDERTMNQPTEFCTSAAVIVDSAAVRRLCRAAVCACGLEIVTVGSGEAATVLTE
jgi:hypothetical protein